MALPHQPTPPVGVLQGMADGTSTTPDAGDETTHEEDVQKDTNFGYVTQKVVFIRDRWLGILYNALLALIMTYVILFQCMWGNAHFEKRDVSGVGRIWFQHPTQLKNETGAPCEPNGDPACKSDWKPLSQLPYCRQSPSESRVEQAKDCIFADKHSIQGLEETGESDRIFLPTVLVRYDEVRSCTPNATNGYTCKDNEYKQVNKSNMTFYADVENIMLQLTSSYGAGGDGDAMSGTSDQIPARLEECDWGDISSTKRSWNDRINGKACESKKLKEKAFTCRVAQGKTCKVAQPLHAVPHFMRRWQEKAGVSLAAVGLRARDEPVPAPPPDEDEGASPRATALPLGWGAWEEGETHDGAGSMALESARLAGGLQKLPYWTSASGDCFTVGKLLLMAGANLDNDMNMDKLSSRQTGTIIVITAYYTNAYPLISSWLFFTNWFNASAIVPKYVYKVREQPIPYISREMLTIDQPADYPKRRSFELQYGILVVFQVDGVMLFGNSAHMLIIFSIFGGLMGVATLAVDFCMVNVSNKRRNYFHMKYDVTSAASDMWECQVCGFHNKRAHARCRGVEQWTNEEDNGVCGAPRPGASTSVRDFTRMQTTSPAP